MSLRDDMKKVQQKVEVIEQESFALSILSDFKIQNKRMFIVLMTVIILWFATIGYLVFILNDIQTDIDTIDIQEVEKIDNSHIKIGNDIWEESK